MKLLYYRSQWKKSTKFKPSNTEKNTRKCGCVEKRDNMAINQSSHLSLQDVSWVVPSSKINCSFREAGVKTSNHPSTDVLVLLGGRRAHGPKGHLLHVVLCSSKGPSPSDLTQENPLDSGVHSERGWGRSRAEARPLAKPRPRTPSPDGGTPPPCEAPPLKPPAPFIELRPLVKPLPVTGTPPLGEAPPPSPHCHTLTHVRPCELFKQRLGGGHAHGANKNKGAAEGRAS